MSMHIDTNAPRYKQAAAEILRRHNIGAPEANITTAVRDFLTVSGLVKADEIEHENPPAEGSRRAVDLAALDTFIEFKKRIGTSCGLHKVIAIPRAQVFIPSAADESKPFIHNPHHPRPTNTVVPDPDPGSRWAVGGFGIHASPANPSP